MSSANSFSLEESKNLSIGKGLKHRYIKYLVTYSPTSLNFLPNDKILDWSKLKALADDKNKPYPNLFFFFFFFFGGGGEEIIFSKKIKYFFQDR